eukprot:Sspe_Gene.39808::Locus_19192_Transcript_1_3_Confidence_0.667_Length_1295::g.39808::m.39808
MSNWALAYGGACSQQGIMPRVELKDEDDNYSHIELNGNCPERFSNRVDDIEAVALAQALAQTENIVHMNLSYNKITDEGARALSGMLRRNSSLNHLDLAYNEIGHRGWRSIADALMSNQGLTYLNMSGNNITGERNSDWSDSKEVGGMAIGTMLQANHTLRTLNLTRCGLGVCSIVGIAQALIDHPSLTSLGLGSPCLQGVQEELSVAQHLSELLRRNNVLTELDLTRFRLNDDQFSTLLPAYVFNDSLTSLLVSANRLTQDGGQEIAKLLTRRHDLSVVDVSYNKLDSAGAKAIAQALRINQGIVTLNLAHCSIGEDGLVALADGLQGSLSISHLQLWGNMWTPKAAKVFYANRARLEEMGYVDFEFQVVDGVPQVVLAEGGDTIGL